MSIRVHIRSLRRWRVAEDHGFLLFAGFIQLRSRRRLLHPDVFAEHIVANKRAEMVEDHTFEHMIRVGDKVAVC
eukprot:425509-Amphidinium_carterae.1